MSARSTSGLPSRSTYGQVRLTETASRAVGPSVLGPRSQDGVPPSCRGESAADTPSHEEQHRVPIRSGQGEDCAVDDHASPSTT
jgi:hypothetical protein